MASPTTDPSTVALISGGMALGGVVIGGVINFWLSRQRAKHEREMFALKDEKERRENAIRLKLEKIENTFELLFEIDNIGKDWAGIVKSTREHSFMSLATLMAKLVAITSNIQMLSDLYIGEVGKNVSELNNSVLEFAKSSAKFLDDDNVKLNHSAEITKYLKATEPHLNNIHHISLNIRCDLVDIVKEQDLVSNPFDKKGDSAYLGAFERHKRRFQYWS